MIPVKRQSNICIPSTPPRRAGSIASFTGQRQPNSNCSCILTADTQEQHHSRRMIRLGRMSRSVDSMIQDPVLTVGYQLKDKGLFIDQRDVQAGYRSIQKSRDRQSISMARDRGIVASTPEPATPQIIQSTLPLRCTMAKMFSRTRIDHVVDNVETEARRYYDC
ncbi:hypothetical protein AUEXF2481DRAFT_454931 [Aureobasidium subglaciale EXF-2481]|uniref:Uncharacterized protein n=1 Tax=Aureobasidium subglaciale (strain EXF-2481) TaxID=1043005 RepID=A0A074YY93_AURSE|nr:uncharacterized protein AUEXF2481DRAFT_454931 [Aureobasidium subglaciale EXF-2481]KEQ91846.1 hypothetical protein AUEXF2481DRAFT_454931 [Aureobasidium subglaciale EXF-2481]